MPASRISSISPWHLVLVLDDSGSMQGAPIRMLNEAIERMIDEMKLLSGGMKPYFRISIVSFGSEAKILSEAENEQDIDIKDVTGMKGKSGGTMASKALARARSILERNPGEPSHFDPFLFFFSDGHPHDANEALLEGERIKALSLPSGTVRLITIGVGQANEEFLRQLATQREGIPRYLGLKNVKDVLDFFPDIGTIAVSMASSDKPAADKLEEDFVVIE